MLNLFADLVAGEIDIIAGVLVDVSPIYAFSDPTVRYGYETYRWFVPCPNQIARVQRVTKIFSASAWIMMGFVLMLCSIVIWCQMSKQNSRKLRKDTFSQYFLTVWAILLGVSAPNIPNFIQERIFFMMFVIYSFAISTVFQAFFTTFLIEPGYEVKFQNIEHLVKSNISYGETTSAKVASSFFDYQEYKKFKHTITCPNYTYCAEKVLSSKTATLLYDNFATYIGWKKGLGDGNKMLCFLDEIIVSVGLTVGISKGSPLLHMFNNYLTRCIEGGIMEVYWSRLKHEVNLQVNDTHDGNTEFFVFSMIHLSPVFILLILGYSFSATVLIGEIITKCCKTSNRQNLER
ncbi:hypothetical protein L9F63_012968 [Diploptera punctata]|uniref:Ionotropic glutamate receptor C-terminal domain-containing protein n=1 Tax=Diploptera punctata TaxID=6984 RepID=A0AAD8ABV4_DIPPU|nr:hypothetical protein L9F63_012968 [Diploptera punctata]